MRRIESPGRGLLRAAAAVVLGAALGLTGVSAALADTRPADLTADSSCTVDPSTACIQGTLKDDNGNPVGGVDVTATAPDGSTAKVTTGDDGVFLFKATEAGDYQVALDASTLPDGVTAAADSTTAKAVTLGKKKPVVLKLTGHGEGSHSNQVGATSFGQVLYQAATQGLLLGLLLALASIGLSLVYGTTGLSNFAHGEQVSLGGLLTGVFAISLGWPFPLAVLMAVVIGAATGYVQDWAIWAPLRRRGLGVNQLMIVTIGLSFSLQYLFQYIWGALPMPVSTDAGVIGGPLLLTPAGYWSMGVSIVVLVGVGLVLSFTRIGRAIRAVADNRALAASSGIDSDRLIRLVWTVAMALAALAGAMYAWTNNGVRWSTGVSLLLLMFSAVTLGGIGTAFGALVGSLVIGVVVQITGIWLPGDLKYATALLALIVILIFRPQGLFGRRGRIG